MKMELNDELLNEVSGGTVVISKNTMNIGFSTMGVKYPLQNCTYRDARDYRDDLLDQNPNMNGPEFDQFCFEQFVARGWITP